MLNLNQAMKFPIMLSAFLLAFAGTVFAQTYPTFQLDTDKPEAGREIHFVYTGAFSKKIDPRLTMYCTVNDAIRWKTLSTKYNGTATTGSFTIPDSVQSIEIRTRNGRDTTEAFIFYVTKNGKLEKGALISSLSFFNNDIYGIRNPDKVRNIYSQEFAKYPDLKQKYLLSYYQDARPSDNNYPVIVAELNKTWVDSMANGTDELFMTRLAPLMVRQNHTDPDQLNEQLIAKYPNGITAFNKESADLIKNKIPAGDFQKDLTAMEIKYASFVPEGKFDHIYSLLAQMSFKQGDLKNAEYYVDKIRYKPVQKDFYANAARGMLNNSSADLHQAETYIQRAIALTKFTLKPYYVFDQQQWSKTLEGTIGSYLAISAQIQYKLGNVKEAISRLESALPKANFNNDIKELYLQYLLATGENKTAVNTAAKYIEQGDITAQIKNLLKEAYTKENNGSEGYDDYFKSIMKKAELQYVLPEYSKLNVPAIDFSLKDIQGKTISLSDYKGKAVVLYFFTPDPIVLREQRSAFNNYFSKVAKAHSGSDVAFLAIDVARISEDDEVNGRPIRIQKIRDFLTKNDLSFEVLMDSYHHDPHSTAPGFYVMADNYSSDSVCQFYVIDKNRIVRYKSFPYSPMPVEKFEQELNAALKLVE